MTVHQVCVCNRTPCPNNIQFLPNQNLPHIAVQFNNRPLTVLIDTGAQVPLIDEHYCKFFSSNETSSQVKFSTKTVQAIGCDGTQLQITGTITGKFQFHQYDDPPLFAEFYILKKCSQQCIFPFTWLKALKVIIDLNTLSLQYEHPSEEGWLLAAEGSLTQERLHEQEFWSGAPNEHHHHFVDVDFKPKGSHHSDQDNQDDDQNDDKDPLCIEDDGDDDDENDNHHAIDLQNDDVIGDGHNDDIDNDDETSTNASQIPFNLPSLTIQPKSSLSRLLTQRDPPCLQKTPPGLYHHDEFLSITVWKTLKGRTMLRLFNDSHQTVTIKLSQLRFRKPPSAVRILPIKLKKWTINTLSVQRPHGDNQVSAEAVDLVTQQLQSSYSNFSKSLENIPLNSDKIPFSVPANIKNHPFDQSTSPLTILHVYLLLLIGSNFKYMTKSQQELKEIVTISGLAVHQRALVFIENLFKKGKVHKMYSRSSLYIVGLVHLIFLDHQRRQTALENKETRQNNRLREERRLQHSLLVSIKSTAALYFYNQKLINQFFQNTLQHPYFQQFKLPLSFSQTLRKLGLGSDHVDKVNLDHKNADPNHDPDPVNHDHGAIGDDDDVDDDDENDNHHAFDLQNDDDTYHNDDLDNNDDIHDHAHDDHHQDLAVNALTLHPPSPLPNKSSLSQLLNEPSLPYQPQSLSFRQYADRLHQMCESVSHTQKVETKKSVFSGKKVDLSKMSPQEIKSYVEYSKSPRRLVDFLEDQIPNSNSNENLSSVPELIQSIPLPRWVIYKSETQILDDYIPNCLRQNFNLFFKHLKDPVFIKYSSIFPLPYPPTKSLLQADPPDVLHSKSGLVDPKVLASTVSQFLTHDHPLVIDPTFYLEFLQLACILYSFGNFNVSLHALDTGSFRREFQVQTLLAPNAPVSSFPSRAATENIDEDLDERLDFLIQQGKCQVILGSPFLNQITSVPKKYKTGQIIHSTKSDPILSYIERLSVEQKSQLSAKSQEIADNQRFLIKLLDDPAAPLPPDTALSLVANSSKIVWFGQLLDPVLARLEVYNLGPKMGETQNLQFESSVPPTPSEISSFSRYLTRADSKSNKTRRPPKVSFGNSCIMHINNSDFDIQDRLSFVDNIRFRNNYFMSPQDGHIYQKRHHAASIGTYSQKLVGSISVPSRNQHDVQFLTTCSPNVAQLAKNKLNLGWAKNQRFLANANTISFCIDQISSGALFNMISNDDHYYESMKKLASDPTYLQQAHIASKTNQNNSNLVKYCLNVTLNESKQTQNLQQTKLFGNIQIPKQGSQLFSGFVNNIITSMRRLDHKQPLKASHQLKRNVLDVITALDPNLDSKATSFDYKEITLKQMCDKYDHWVSFLDKISDHYKIVAIWLFVQVNQRSRYKQDILISEVAFSNLQLFTSAQSDFILIPINPTTSEFYKIRADNKFCREILLSALQNKWNRKLSMSQLITNMQNQKAHDKNIESQEPMKPRYSKVHYHHINKNFYHKNSIHRIIQASKDSNKLARPILSRAVQSQNDVLRNLGASELFSNYDLTSGYDSLPADPISSLTNVASYRNQEFAFLCASQGGSNSVLFMQRAVCSLLFRIKDEMVLQECFSPCPISDLEPSLQTKFCQEEKDTSLSNPSVSESWMCRPHINRPGPRLLKAAQKMLLSGPRKSTIHHILPLDLTQRQKLLDQTKEDRFISSSALVDDLVMSSKAINSEEYRALSEPEKLRIHFKIHIFILLSIFSAIDALSVDPGPNPPFKSSLKLRLEKSVFASTSIRYLNIVYLRGYKAIDLQNFKKSAVHISELPSTGDDLRSAIGFFAFLINFVPNLRYHLKSLAVLADAHPAKKSIIWSNYPDLQSSYLNLCKVVQNNTALHTLPDDLAQISKFVLNADACNASLSYLSGFTLLADAQNQHMVQNVRPFKFHSAKLPQYTENLNILIKEIFAALFAVLDNLPQIKLLPPSVKRCIIVDSKPLYNIMSKFQKNGYLDTFFISHPSIPLYLNRLHQLVTEHEIQIYVMPTKNSPPADFITRPTQSDPISPEKFGNEISCASSVTTKRVDCQLCPGCQVCCIRKNPHSGCPFSISAAPSTEPKLLSANKIEEKTVIVDGQNVHFRDNQISVDWDKLEQISFQSFLANSCYSPFLQNLSEHELSQLNAIDLEFKTMLDQSSINLQQLKLAQDSVSQLFSQINREDTVDHHGNDHSNDSDNDDNHHAHAHPSADDKHHDPHSSLNTDQNNHIHNHDQDPDQLQNNPPSNNTSISINSIHHDHLNDNHDQDDNDSDVNKDDDPPTPMPFPERRLFCIQSDKHQCFQPNFTVATSKKHLRFSSPSNSTVIVFVTQKKRWHLAISQFISVLKNTAAANLTLNPNQIQELTLGKVKYLILCVATDIQEPNSLQMSSLVPNLRRCVQKSVSHNIYYDGNSIMLTYQCLPQNAILAIQLIARSHPAHHCLAFNSHEKITKFVSEPRQLCLQLPLIFNGARQQILSVQLNASPQYSLLCKSVRNQIFQEVSRLLPPLVSSQTRKCAVVDLAGRITDLLNPALPLDLTSIHSVLVKDNHPIKCLNGKHRRSQPNFVTNINLMKSSDPSLSQEILSRSGRRFSTFMIRTKTPLQREFYPGLLSLYKGHCSPIFDARCFPLSQMRQLCAYYPEIDEIILDPHSFNLNKPNHNIKHGRVGDKDNPHGNNDDGIHDDDHQNNDDHHDHDDDRQSVNVIGLSEPSTDILCQYLGEFNMLYLSQSNNQLIQSLIRQIQDSPDEQIIIKDTIFQIFDGLLYGQSQNKENSADHFKPVIPDDRLLPLILKLHSQSCAPPRRIISKIRQTFCHVHGTTSNISLERITAALLPCYKCLTMKPAHMTTSLSMQYKTIGLQAQGKKICSIVAIDVFYLADAHSKVFSNNYISFIICLSCKFLHLKPISRISSYALAQHLLEFVRLTGKTPSILVSDAATTNLFGEMQILLKDFQLMHVTANHNILNGMTNDNNHAGHTDHDNADHAHHTDHDNKRDADDDHNDDDNDHNDDNRHSAPYLSVPLHLLSPDQKKFLLQDLSLSDPPLYPPTLRHCPVSYKANQLNKQTSLGSLDNACKRLQIFLKKTVTYLPNQKEFKKQIEFLVSCFEYQNNFCLEAEATKLIPASIHLGSIRASNILNLMKNIQDLKKPNSQNFQHMQELLNNSKKILEAGENTLQKVSNQQARQLKEHGKVKHPGDIIRQLKPLDVLFVKSEVQKRPKMSFLANFHGPFLVLAVQPKNEHLILFGLISGEVLIKNFKQIRSAFSNEVFSMPLFSHLGDEVQFRMVTPLTRMAKQSSAQNVLTNSTRIITNLYKISNLLTPLLPDFKETQNYLRTIHLSLEDNDENNDHAELVSDNHDNNGNNDNDNKDHDHPNDPNTLQTDPHDHTPLKIYVKPSVSFDISTKQGDDSDKHHNEDNDDNDDHLIDGDDVQQNGDYPARQTPPVRLHGIAPSTENLESQPPQQQKAKKPVRFTRPKESVPTAERPHKYSLRENPTPSKKYQ